MAVQTLSAIEWARLAIERLYLSKHGAIDQSQIDKLVRWYVEYLHALGIGEVTVNLPDEATKKRSRKRKQGA